MPTKEQIGEGLNDALGTDLEWSKMKKEDLEHLHMLVDEGLLIEPLAKHIAADKGSEFVEDQIQNWTPGQLISKL